MRDYDDNEFGEAEEYVFDTYDQIIDETEIDSDAGEHYDDLSPADTAMAFALAESMREDRIGDLDEPCDVDENTDKENWEKVSKVLALQSRYDRKSKRRPFEEFVDDICSGRRGLFD